MVWQGQDLARRGVLEGFHQKYDQENLVDPFVHAKLLTSHLVEFSLVSLVLFETNDNQVQQVTR